MKRLQKQLSRIGRFINLDLFTRIELKPNEHIVLSGKYTYETGKHLSKWFVLKVGSTGLISGYRFNISVFLHPSE